MHLRDLWRQAGGSALHMDVGKSVALQKAQSPGKEMGFLYRTLGPCQTSAKVQGQWQPRGTGPLETSKPTDHIATGAESKNFANGFLGVILRDATPFPPLIPTPMNRTVGQQQTTSDTHSGHAAFWRTLCHPARYCHLTSAITQPAKGLATICQFSKPGWWEIREDQ